jgi:hypothetical protein
MKMSGHRLVVGNALRVVAFYDAEDFVRCIYRFLLHYFVVSDDAENYLGGYNGQT